MFSAYVTEKIPTSRTCNRFVRTSHVITPSAIFAAAAPIAAMRIPFFPPILSTSGPLTKNENA